MSDRTLIISLDGVPGALFNELYDAGGLPNLRGFCDGGLRIRNLLSAFPSDSLTCYPLALNGEEIAALRMPAQTWFHRERGRYVDLWDFFPLWRLRQQTRGDGAAPPIFSLSQPSLCLGIPTVRGAPRSIPGFQCIFGAGLSPFGFWYDRMAFCLMPQLFRTRPLIGYMVVSTDHMGHTYGRRGFVAGLKNFDAALGRLLRIMGDDLNLLVFSDHGNMPMRGLFDLEGAARRAGFRITRRISERRDAVISCNMLNYAHIYTGGASEELGRALAACPEVGLAGWRTPRGVRVANDQGVAEIRETDGKFAYLPESGDPLEVADLLPPGRLLTPHEWLQAAGTAELPGAFRMCQFLQNPRAGDVALSFDRGFCPPVSFALNGLLRLTLGGRLVRRLIWFSLNHGGLHRDQSLTFALARGRGFPHEEREFALLEDVYGYLSRHLQALSG